MSAINSWHVRVRKLTRPYNFKQCDFGYWNKIKTTKRILKRCDCPLVNIPRAKREIVKMEHLSLWRD